MGEGRIRWWFGEFISEGQLLSMTRTKRVPTCFEPLAPLYTLTRKEADPCPLH